MKINASFGLFFSALHLANNHTNRVSSYKKWEINIDVALNGIEFPVKLSDVPKFSKRRNVSINVYCFDNNSYIAPLLITKVEKKDMLVYCIIKIAIVG